MKPRIQARNTMKIADLQRELALSDARLSHIMREVNIRLAEGQKNLDQQEVGRIRQYLNEQRRREELQKQQIKLPSIIKVQELAARLELPVGNVLSTLLKNGVVATLNDDVDYDTAAIVAADLGYTTEEDVTELEKDVLTPEKLEEILNKEDTAKQQDRPPVVTIMGHVDHGKCVHPETSIILASGQRKIARQLWKEYAPRGKQVHTKYTNAEVRAVRRGPRVITWNGEQFESARITHLWRLRSTHPLLKFTVCSGDVIAVTPEHPFLVCTPSGKMVFRKAEHIRQSDFLVVPQTLPLSSVPLQDLKEAIVLRLAAAGNFIAFLNPEGTEQVRSLLRTAGREKLLRKGILSTFPSSRNPSRYRLKDLLRLAREYGIKESTLYDWIGGLKNATEKWRAGHTSNRIRLPRTPDEFEQVGYLLGVIAGDGHLDGNEVAIHNNDREIQSYCMKVLHNVFGVHPLLGHGHTADKVLSGGGKTLVRFLAHVFDIPVGAKSASIRVPELVQQSHVIRVNFIAGVFDTVGYVSHLNHSAEIISKSPELIKDIAILLLEHGVHAALSRVKKGNRHRTYTLLRIANKPYLQRFLTYYPVRHPGKRERLSQAVRKSSTSRIFDNTPIPGEAIAAERIPESVFPYFNRYKQYQQLSRAFLTRVFREHRELFDRCFGSTQLKPLVNPGEISLVQVAKIERAHAPYVYDFSVPTHKNFVAERTIIHNTTLLDSIRETNVAAQEAGGITQAISSYQVEYKGRTITFIDTPGHETFEFMRKRGASLADIAVLVVAADDGVKPQTKEAVKHAREAGVPIVVAINKIDKAEANLDRVKGELAELDLQPEEWGGKTVTVPVSALKKQGIDDLLEMILLTADIDQPKAVVDRPALGSVVESRLDKNLGPLATVLIHTGTLRTGDNIVIGRTAGRVRRLLDWRNKDIRQATPSMPATIVGLEYVPQAGDIMQVVEEKGEARLKAASRRAPVKRVASSQEEDERKTLALILKADSQGSLEALEQTIKAMVPQDVRLAIIRAEVGNVSDSDVLTAQAAGAIVYAFNTKIGGMAQKLAQKEHVPVKYFNVIYQLSEDARKEIEERLPVDIITKHLGRLKVLKVFFSTQRKKIVGGEIAEGVAETGAKVNIWRPSSTKATEGKAKIQEKVGRGIIIEMQREKQTIEKAQQGDQVGMTVEGKGKIKEGDVLEIYQESKVKRQLQ